MQLPKLRLRKVFEHGTHFTVHKPSGQSITIAKKGLSPGIVKRYQRLARGGDVRNYQIGGDVADTDVEGNIAKDVSTAEGTPETTEASRFKGRVFLGTPGQMLSQETPEQSAERMRRDEKPAVPVAAAPAPTAAPAPPPVTVNVNTAPAPVAPAPVSTPTPQAQTPAPIEPVAVKRPDRPEMVDGFTPFTKNAPRFMFEEKAFAPPPEFVRPLGLEPIPLQVPALAEAAVPVAGPTAATPAAPLAAPIAPAAPVPVPAPAPPEPIVVRPLTAESLLAEAKKSPDASVADLVAKIAPDAVGALEIVAPESAQVSASEILKQGGLANLYVQGLTTGINAAVEQGRAQATAAKIEIDELERQRIAAAEKALRDATRQKELETHATTLQSEAEGADNLKSFFASQGTAYSVFSTIALAIGGALSGYTKTPNYVLSAFNNAMQQDLAEQMRNRNSKWQRYKEALGSAEAATDLVNADNAMLISIAAKKASARAGLEKIKPQMDMLIGALKTQAAKDMASLDLRLAQAEDEREKPAPRIVVGRGGGRTPTVAEQRFEEAKKTSERERLVSVEGIPVRRATKSRQAMTQDDIDRRVAYVVSVAKLEKALKDYGSNVWNVLATERGDIIADLALSLENSPQGFGYSRALSLNAGRVLKAGMGSPDSLKSAVLAQFGRDPIAGVRKLREDTQSQFKQKLAGLADPSSKRDKDASKYASWVFDNRINKTLGGRSEPAPKLDTPVEHIVSLPPDSPLYQPTAAAAPAAGTPAAAPNAAQKPTADELRSRARRAP